MNYSRTVIAGCAMVLSPLVAYGQTPAPPRPSGRLSFYVTSDHRSPKDGEGEGAFNFATSLTFRTPEMERRGVEVGVDVRHTAYAAEMARPQRVSIYDGYVGMRFGSVGQIRARAGHLWLPDLGTAGALAGGLVEYRSGTSTDRHRWKAGAFAGAEPLGYEAGYAAGVRKFGGYLSLERGFLQRSVVGFARIQQQGLNERSLLTVTNYLPARKSIFVYQALEYDLQGPADGAATGGLSYFLVNARASAGSRVDLTGTYNRGRSLNARQLTDDVLNGRPLSAQALDGFRYQTAGGRISVRVTRHIDIYGGYARDRNNRDDVAMGRFTTGGHAGNLLNTGLDVSVSAARIEQASGAYHSTYVSAGRSVGRAWYVSADYSTSLAVVHFQRSDGVTIETRPTTKRVSANVSATLGRQFSLLGVVDYTMDADLTDLRIMTGITYRLR